MSLCPACKHDFQAPPGEFPARCPGCGVLVLGPYCDLEWIGGGGMGDVYRAREPQMGDRIVAIKIPQTGADTHSVQRRFEREIVASGRLQHENAVRAYHRGEEAGRPYLVMEFVAGVKLSDLIWREHPLSPRRVGQIVLGLARGLAHAQRQGVVNRDLKPANVLLTPPDDTPKLLDYGLALITDRPEEFTRDGSLLGTPNYIAPEQSRDPHGVTIAADVYSLGCTAYCCLTGHPPFEGRGADEVQRLRSASPRPSVREARPDVPAELDELVRAMIAPEPAGRPAPDEIVRTLGALLPRLSDQAPPLSRAAGGTPIDVVCPGCRTRYHLSPAMAGQRVRCPNRVCGTILTVPEPQEALIGPADAAEPADDGLAEVLEARLLEDDLPPVLAAEALAGAGRPGGLEEPPLARVEARAVEGPEEEVAVLPAAAVVVPGSPAAPPAGESLVPPPVGEPPVAPVARSGAPAAVPAAVPAVIPSSRRSARAQRRRQRRTRRIRALAIAAVGAMAIVAAVLLYLHPPRWGSTADRTWDSATELVAQHKWAAASRKLDEFERDYADDSRVEQVPFFRDLCQAGPEIYSTTGNPARGLALAQEIFKNHRDNPAYSGYCGDLYQALAFLIDSRFLPEAAESSDAEPLARAREALELLSTVGRAMPEAWVPERTAQMASDVAQAERVTRRASARGRVLEHLARLQRLDPEVRADELYAAIEKLLAAEPSLRADKEIASLWESAYRAEAGRVRYVAQDARAPGPSDDGRNDPPGSSSQGDTLAVVWGNPAGAAAAPPDEPLVVALARGMLYAFDLQGHLLWARRLGVDSVRLPGRIGPTASASAALVAVSSEERSLLALEATPEGRLRWRYGVGHDLVAPLCIVPRRAGANDPVQYCGFLPTAEGEVHVLELVLGKPLGRYAVGQPMTVGGTFDPSTGLAFFPADANRVFALDPAAIDDPKRPACRSMLLTRHASGALRAEPVVVGPYLVVAEDSELEHTRLRVFQLHPDGFARPTAAPLRELGLRGSAWFRPLAAPDRVTLVTDRGELGLFGLNLDNLSEAIYPIVQDGPSRPTVGLDVEDRSRTLTVAAAEHLLWVMAGGRLEKLAVDVVRQRVRRLWPRHRTDLGVFGVPVHEAQTDRLGSVLFIATQSPGGSYHFTAVDAQSGRRHWQCQLGLMPLGDPVAWQGQVVLIDATGRKLALRPGDPAGAADRPRTIQLPARQPLPEGADAGQALRLGEPPGPIHLVVPVDGGSKLAVCAILRDTEAEPGPWTVLALPDRLQGRPCLSDGWLVVPCADGQLYRLRPDSAAPIAKNEVTFTWSRSRPPGPMGAEVYSLASRAVLLVDRRQRLRRLETTTKDLVTRWTEVGEGFHLPSPIQGRPLVAGERIFVFDSAGTLFTLDAANPNRQAEKPLPTGRKITAGPFLCGSFLVAIADQRSLVGVPLARPIPPPTLAQKQPVPPPAGKQPTAPPAFWVSEETMGGRIRGAPVLAGDVLLVAHNGREVAGVRLADGKTAWKVPLETSVGPAAAPVPFGPGKMLLPLADGTLQILSIPTPQRADVRP